MLTVPKDTKDTKVPKVPKGANWIAAGAVLLLGLAGYGHLLQQGTIPYSPHSDVISEHLAKKTVLHRSIEQGRGIPFWRSDQFSGNAALTNPQSMYTYPLHALFLLGSPADVMGAAFWLHFVIAALSFYLLGAALRLGLWARLLMAAAGMFSFKLILATYAGWLPIVPGIVLAPALVAAVIHLARRPGPGSALGLALAGGLCLHSGHLQMFYYAALFSAAWLVVQTVDRLRGRQLHQLAPTAGWLAVGAALAAGLAAYLLLPLAGEAEWISRSQTSYEFHLAGLSMEPRHLSTFIHPEALGTPLDGSYPGHELWEQVAYFGIVPLLLAAAGAVLGWRRPPARFFVAGFFATLLLSMDTPVGRLFFHAIPAYGLFRLPVRMLFFTSMCGIALAGIGLERLIGRLGNLRSPALAAGGVSVALIGLIAAEGTMYARRYLAVAPQDQVVPRTGYGDLLASDDDLYRVAPLGRATLNYGWSASMDLQLVTGYDPFNYRQYHQYFDILQHGRSLGGARVWLDLERIERWDLLDQLNVKYLLSGEPIELPGDEHIEELARFDDQPMFVFYRGMRTGPVHVYRNNRFVPRVRWAGELIETADEREMLEQVQANDLNVHTVVENKSEKRFQNLPSADDRVELTSWAPGRLTVETRSRESRFLVASEVWHPGWRAHLDGRDVKILRTNLTMLGVQVPAGEHRLELEFRPLYWTAGLVVSLIALAAFLGLTIFCFQSHKRWW